MSAVQSLDQFVYGSGDDDKSSLAERIRTVWELAKSPTTAEKLGGKACDLVTVIINIEGKDSRQLVNRDIKVSETPDAVASWARKELENDPGPSFNGTLRAYFRIFGASENGKLGSYQREITGAPLPSAGDSNASIIAIQTAIIQPILQKVVEQSDASSRMLNAHAGVMEKISAGLGTVLEIVKGNRVAENGNPIMAFLGQAMQAAGAAGAPGAAPAGRAISMMARSSGPPAWVPDISSRSGVTRTAAVPEFGVTGGSSTPASSPASTSPSTPASSPKITRADVEAWGRAHPDEAEAMVKDSLRARGFPV